MNPFFSHSMSLFDVHIPVTNLFIQETNLIKSHINAFLD